IAQSQDEEAKWIAAYLTHLHTDGRINRWNEAAVLVRTHKQRVRLATALRTAGLHVRSGATSLGCPPK
ncbi:MAG: hypothetical protein ACRD1G_03405, partial [Acidimicrobiales bacterium]